LAYDSSRPTPHTLGFLFATVADFPGGPNGDYDTKLHRGKGGSIACAPQSLMNAVPLDEAVRSRRLDMHALETGLIVPWLSLGGGEVLQTHELSRAAWWAHSHAAPTASGTRDCTHWCMPGIPDVWATMLLRLLTSGGRAIN
jgi:hypothetical protein